MFKKMLLSATLVMGITVYGFSEFLDIPSGPSSQLCTSDYGGANYSTSSFSSNNTLAFDGQGVFQGILVTSFTYSSPPESVIFRDTHTVLTSETTNEIFRVSLATGASNTFSSSDGTGAYNFIYKPPVPIRFKRGMAFKPSIATLGKVTVLWTKFDN